MYEIHRTGKKLALGWYRTPAACRELILRCSIKIVEEYGWECSFLKKIERKKLSLLLLLYIFYNSLDKSKSFAEYNQVKRLLKNCDPKSFPKSYDLHRKVWRSQKYFRTSKLCSENGQRLYVVARSLFPFLYR